MPVPLARLFALSCVSILLMSMGLPPGGVDPRELKTLEQTCRDYADAAVRQFHEMQKRKCGFTGPAWSDKSEHHYEWCIRTRAALANSENRKRQDQLASCPADRTCDAYARTAVRQQAENRKYGCNYQPPVWNDSYDDHYNWCTHGQNRTRADLETRRRNRELARCKPNTVLDGDFSILSVKPVLGGSSGQRVVDSVRIEIETDSANPFMIGDYGHGEFGSLWVDLTIASKVWLEDQKRVETRSRSYVFAVRGTNHGGTRPALMRPVMGHRVQDRKRRLILEVSPMPRMPFTGVEQIFSLPSQPLQPGSLGCWYHDPEISVTVYMIRKKPGLQFQPAPLEAVSHSARARNVDGATYIGASTERKGGGVIYTPCLWKSTRP